MVMDYVGPLQDGIIILKRKLRAKVSIHLSMEKVNKITSNESLKCLKQRKLAAKKLNNFTVDIFYILFLFVPFYVCT